MHSVRLACGGKGRHRADSAGASSGLRGRPLGDPTGKPELCLLIARSRTVQAFMSTSLPSFASESAPRTQPTSRGPHLPLRLAQARVPPPALLKDPRPPGSFGAPVRHWRLHGRRGPRCLPPRSHPRRRARSAAPRRRRWGPPRHPSPLTAAARRHAPKAPAHTETCALPLCAVHGTQARESRSDSWQPRGCPGPPRAPRPAPRARRASVRPARGAAGPQVQEAAGDG